MKRENAETEAEEQQAAEEVKKENTETETEEQQAAEEAKRENAETESEGQQAAEEAKRENTEENNVEQKTDEKMEEMKQKNQEHQPQAAETQTAQEGQAQAKPEKPNLIADSDVDWKELEQFGVKRENLSEKDMKALMNYGKTRLVTVEPVLGGERYELQAQLSLQKAEDGKLKLTPHFVRHEPRLDVPYNGYTFTDEDKQALKQTGNLGKLVSVADTKTGEMRLTIFSENINAHLSYLNY